LLDRRWILTRLTLSCSRQATKTYSQNE